MSTCDVRRVFVVSLIDRTQATAAVECFKPRVAAGDAVGALRKAGAS